jgi:transposase InsO family protein
MKRDLVIRTLNMAIAFRSPPQGCIHHTDRGSQYCSHDYQKILRQHGLKFSPLMVCKQTMRGERMSGNGNCYDNAAVETFFKTTPFGEYEYSPAGQGKAELIWRRSWQTRRQAEIAIFKYINGFYSARRRHSTRVWKSHLSADYYAIACRAAVRFRTKGALKEHLGRH